MLLIGMAAKAAGVIAFRIFGWAELLAVLTVWDPVGMWFAESGVGLIFDMRGIAAPAGADVAFDFLLVVSFGLQCGIVGWGWDLIRSSLGR